MDKVPKIDRSNTAPSSKTFRDEWCGLTFAGDFYGIPHLMRPIAS
jgi:hypothetical protein